jgi:hypothetical protein
MAQTIGQHARVRPNYRKILIENVEALMEADGNLDSHAKIAAAARRAGHKIGKRTVGHLLNAEDGAPQPRLPTIVAVADAFKVAPWMLLMPELGERASAEANTAAQTAASYDVPERRARAIEELHERAAQMAGALRGLYVDITGRPLASAVAEVRVEPGRRRRRA